MTPTPSPVDHPATDPVRLDLTRVGAVLLDMDGTIVDSDAAVERAWRRWSAEYGVDPEAALVGAHGNPADRNVRRLLPALDADAVRVAAQRQLALQYDDPHDVAATPGALELLDGLRRRGIAWGVVTSADRALAAARLPGIEAAHAPGMPVATLRGLPGEVVLADLPQLADLLGSRGAEDD